MRSDTKHFRFPQNYRSKSKRTNWAEPTSLALLVQNKWFIKIDLTAEMNNKQNKTRDRANGQERDRETGREGEGEWKKIKIKQMLNKIAHLFFEFSFGLVVYTVCYCAEYIYFYVFWKTIQNITKRSVYEEEKEQQEIWMKRDGSSRCETIVISLLPTTYAYASTPARTHVQYLHLSASHSLCCILLVSKEATHVFGLHKYTQNPFRRIEKQNIKRNSMRRLQNIGCAHKKIIQHIVFMCVFCFLAADRHREKK